MKERLLLLCNNLGESILSHGIELLKERYEVKVIKRPQFYPTDLKSAKYSPLRLFSLFMSLGKTKRTISYFLKVIGDEKFDKFLVFGYYQIDEAIVKRIKTNNPNCVTIIYFYDSFCRLNFSNDIKYFDKCFTFDRDDAKKYHIEYLPFFAEKYKSLSVDYDLCHIGSWSPGHLYRLPCLKKISEDLKNTGFSAYFKCTFYDFEKLGIFRKAIFCIRAFFDKEFSMYKKFFRRYKDCPILTDKRISYEDMLNVEASSKCIVEINAQRAGLSPRVINALANGKKIIINCDSIRNEIFYDASNICIINERKPKLDIAFLRKKCKCLDMNDLFLENWLGILLENKFNKYAIK